MPQPRKPAERRQNRATKDLVPASVMLEMPSADESWREGTVERWAGFWCSPLARQVEPSDLGSLRRLFWIYDEVERIREALEETGRVVAGSQGQPRPNPLYKQLSELNAEARQLEDRFGLSPLARLRLGITFADAHGALDVLNTQISERPHIPEDLWDDEG